MCIHKIKQMVLKTIGATFFLSISLSGNAATPDWKACKPYCIKKTSSGTADLYSGMNEKKLSLSVISLDRAVELFNDQVSESKIPFEYVFDKELPHFHLMGKNLAEKGVESAKVAVGGDIVFETELFGVIQRPSRIATLVLVDDNKNVVPYVFDPALFNKPVLYTIWKKTIANRTNYEIFANRYTVGAKDWTKDEVKGYDDNSMNYINKYNQLHTQKLADYKDNWKSLKQQGLSNALVGGCRIGGHVGELLNFSKQELIRSRAEAERLADSKRAEYKNMPKPEKSATGNKRYDDYVDNQKRVARSLSEDAEISTIFNLGEIDFYKKIWGMLDAAAEKIEKQELFGKACSHYAKAQFLIALKEIVEPLHQGAYEESYQDVFSELLQSADQGFQPAQEALFQFYVNDQSKKYSSRGKSAEFFKKIFREYKGYAEEAADSTAMTNLGMMFQWGIGTDADLKLAVRWYEKAAEKGDSRAMTYLGRIYEFDGKGIVPSSPQKALELYKRAHEAGNGHGTQNYALMRYEKPANEDDEKKLTQLLEKAHRQGFPQAAALLGPRYIEGIGAEKSPERAYSLFQTAASYWMNPDTQGLYLDALLNGVGVVRNFELAKQVHELCKYHPMSGRCDEVWKAVR